MIGACPRSACGRSGMGEDDAEVPQLREGEKFPSASKTGIRRAGELP